MWCSSLIVQLLSVLFIAKTRNFWNNYTSKDLTPQAKCMQRSPVIIIKPSTKAILVTLLLALKIFLSVEIKSWKAPSTITFNLGSFQGKYIWRSSVLVKPLSLRFTVILIMILKFMLLRNFIMIL